MLDRGVSAARALDNDRADTSRHARHPRRRLHEARAIRARRLASQCLLEHAAYTLRTGQPRCRRESARACDASRGTGQSPRCGEVGASSDGHAAACASAGTSRCRQGDDDRGTHSPGARRHGACDRAVERCNQARVAFRRGGDGISRATLQTLAVSYFTAGQLPQADSLYRAELAIDRRIFGERHPQAASDIMDLGSIAFQHAQYVQAESLYRQGVTIDEAWFGPERPAMAGPFLLLGQALVKLGKTAEAGLRCCGVHSRIGQRVHSGPHPDVARTLNALGANAAARDHQAEAEDYYRRSRGHAARRCMVRTTSTWVHRSPTSRRRGWCVETIRRPNDSSATHSPCMRRCSRARSSTSGLLAQSSAARSREARWREAEPELRTAYEIMNKQAPTSEWATSSREDLVCDLLRARSCRRGAEVSRRRRACDKALRLRSKRERRASQARRSRWLSFEPRSALADELAQHVRQDAAVLVVVHLLRRIDPREHLELLRRAVAAPSRER